MTEKTLEDRVLECKAAQKELETFNLESANLLKEIEKLKTDIELLQDQRDKLESSQNNSANLLVSGKMTRDEFTQNKQKLTELYAKIEDAEDLLEIFQKKLNNDSNQLPHLHSQLSGKMRILRTGLAEKLAAEIAEKVNLPLKQLFALLPAISNGIDYKPNIHIGFWLAAAIYGGHYDNPRAALPEDNKELIKNMFDNLGV